MRKVQQDDTLTLGCATGTSPALSYQLIAKALGNQPGLRGKINVFQLDEWYGLGKADQGSCHSYMEEQIVKPWSLGSGQCFLLNGRAQDQDAQLADMRRQLKMQPLDLCVLGLGKNGHLALNEPGSSVKSECRIVELEPSSKAHQMLKVSENKVHKGITIGLREILESREIWLLITGNDKKVAYDNFLKQPAAHSFPAAALFEHHNWKCFVDSSSIN